MEVSLYQIQQGFYNMKSTWTDHHHIISIISIILAPKTQQYEHLPGQKWHGKIIYPPGN